MRRVGLATASPAHSGHRPRGVQSPVLFVIGFSQDYPPTLRAPSPASPGQPSPPLLLLY